MPTSVSTSSRSEAAPAAATRAAATARWECPASAPTQRALRGARSMRPSRGYTREASSTGRRVRRIARAAVLGRVCNDLLVRWSFERAPPCGCATQASRRVVGPAPFSSGRGQSRKARLAAPTCRKIAAIWQRRVGPELRSALRVPRQVLRMTAFAAKNKPFPWPDARAGGHRCLAFRQGPVHIGPIEHALVHSTAARSCVDTGRLHRAI